MAQAIVAGGGPVGSYQRSIGLGGLGLAGRGLGELGQPDRQRPEQQQGGQIVAVLEVGFEWGDAAFHAVADQEEQHGSGCDRLAPAQSYRQCGQGNQAEHGRQGGPGSQQAGGDHEIIGEQSGTALAWQHQQAEILPERAWLAQDPLAQGPGAAAGGGVDETGQGQHQGQQHGARRCQQGGARQPAPGVL